MTVGFALLFNIYGATYAFINAACLLSLLVACAEVDRRTGLIPNVVLLVGTAVALALNIFGSGIDAIVLPLLASAGSSFLLFMIRYGWFVLTARPGFGMGDVKLIGVVSLFIGWNGLWAFYLAAIVGALIGLAGIAMGIWQRDSRIPFAPSIAIGTLVAVVIPFNRAATLLWT